MCAVVFLAAPGIDTALVVCLDIVMLVAIWKAAANRNKKRPTLSGLYRELKTAAKGGKSDQGANGNLPGRTRKRKVIVARATRSAGGAIIPLDDIQFSYIDSNGDFTARRVRVHRIAGDYFYGFCFLRMEQRTFRFDNVSGSIVRTDTGEMLSVDEWLDEIHV
jgi:hypothetical protein